MSERPGPLRAALEDADEGMREMFPYVPEYFAEKWGLMDYITRAGEALEADDLRKGEEVRICSLAAVLSC